MRLRKKFTTGAWLPPAVELSRNNYPGEGQRTLTPPPGVHFFCPDVENADARLLNDMGNFENPIVSRAEETMPYYPL
jgi:hypothetical protein